MLRARQRSASGQLKAKAADITSGHGKIPVAHLQRRDIFYCISDSCLYGCTYLIRAAEATMRDVLTCLCSCGCPHPGLCKSTATLGR